MPLLSPSRERCGHYSLTKGPVCTGCFQAFSPWDLFFTHALCAFMVASSPPGFGILLLCEHFCLLHCVLLAVLLKPSKTIDCTGNLSLFSVGPFLTLNSPSKSLHGCLNREILKVFALKTSLYCYKLSRIPNVFCLYGLHLLFVIVVDIKTDTFKNCLLIYVKVTIESYYIWHD